MKRPSRPKRTRLRAGSKIIRHPSLTPEKQRLLERSIGYKFNDEDLLIHALIHPSLIDEYRGGAGFSNQRMEFLGDRVLGLVIAEILSTRFPKQREGYLTQLFHKLVSGEACAEVGEQFE